MQKQSITIEYTRFESLSELPPDLSALAAEARKASLGSYAPYSKFHVGAAILMADGSIQTGSNQENAAFPSGLCAERTAAFHASAASPGMPMKAIAVAAWTRLGLPDDTPASRCMTRTPISPCGACRQSLLEYETLHGPIRVLLLGAKEALLFPTVKSLLPYSFSEF